MGERGDAVGGEGDGTEMGLRGCCSGLARERDDVERGVQGFGGWFLDSSLWLNNLLGDSLLLRC